MRNLIIGAIFLSLVMSIWGAMYVVVKVVVEVVPPLELVWMRYLIAVIALGIIGIMMRQSWKIAKKDWLIIFLVGLIGNTISIVTQEMGTMLSTAQMGAIITATTPAFMVVFARLILKESITLKKCFSITLATIGVGIVVGNGQIDVTQQLGGLYLLLLCLNVGIDVGIRQKGTKPLLTNCCHNLYIYDCRDVIDPFCPSKAKEFRSGKCFTTDHFRRLALLRHYLNSWWFFIVE